MLTISIGRGGLTSAGERASNRLFDLGAAWGRAENEGKAEASYVTTVGSEAFQLAKRPATQAVRRGVAGGGCKRLSSRRSG